MASFNNRRALQVLLMVSIIISLSLVFKMTQGDAVNDQQQRLTQTQTYKALIEIVKMTQDHYYKEADRQAMYEGALKGALAALGDPYTYYLSGINLQRQRENIYEGRFGGLGIRIYPDNGYVKISMPIPGSPAESVGLQAGDIITRIEKEPVRLEGPNAITVDDVVDRLRGELGTDVTISIHRRGLTQEKEYTITRADIRIDSIQKAVIEDGIGYIKIDNFTGRTEEEFGSALRALQGEMDLQALVLDLRNNPGGMFPDARAVASVFLEEGQLIVSTGGRNKDYDQKYFVKRGGVHCSEDVELLVLVNEYSASGSEIVAGAIKDTKRGILIGHKTFGKGVVQQHFNLKQIPGIASLTISSYYTPSGVSIHGEGISPHVKVDLFDIEDQEILMLNKAIEKHIIEDFVVEHIQKVEEEAGTTPKDPAALLERVPEITERLEKEGIALRTQLIRRQARRAFDLNVGNNRLIDLEGDQQLQKAVDVIHNGEVPRILAAAEVQTDLQ